MTFFALLNKKSIFKKNEKNAWRYYHFTQVYQKSWSYAMLYCSWGMTRDGLLFFILSYFFCPFTLLPLTVRKIKIKKKMWEKNLDMSSFYTSVPKIMIVCYTVPEIWRMMDAIAIFYFGLFFALLHPLTAQKKILKKWKRRLEISFYICVKIMFRWCKVPEIWCATDRRTEKVTYRDGCPT